MPSGPSGGRDGGRRGGRGGRGGKKWKGSGGQNIGRNENDLNFGHGDILKVKTE